MKLSHLASLAAATATLALPQKAKSDIADLGPNTQIVQKIVRNSNGTKEVVTVPLDHSRTNSYHVIGSPNSTNSNQIALELAKQRVASGLLHEFIKNPALTNAPLEFLAAMVDQGKIVFALQNKAGPNSVNNEKVFFSQERPYNGTPADFQSKLDQGVSDATQNFEVGSLAQPVNPPNFDGPIITAQQDQLNKTKIGTVEVYASKGLSSIDFNKLMAEYLAARKEEKPSVPVAAQ